MKNKAKKISDLITSYSRTLQLFEQNKVLGIYNSWESIVGEKIAPHSRLIDIDKNTAIIETDHTGWCQQILLSKKKIIQNFRKKYAELAVTDIVVIVSSYYQHKKNNTVSSAHIQESIPDANTVPISETMPRELTELLKGLRNSILEHEK